MNEIKDYENLIIDITGNGGGNTMYWIDALVRPNIKYSHLWSVSGLMKKTSIYTSYADINMFQYKLDEIKKLPKINLEDLEKEKLELVYVANDILKPLNDKKIFNRKIYLLVDGLVASASEHFAAFSQQTNFATLVGTTTAGEGGALRLYEYPLKNSGLCVRVSYSYSLNPDGSCSMEIGTIPDYISEDGEPPLETCLKVIDDKVK